MRVPLTLPFFPLQSHNGHRTVQLLLHLQIHHNWWVSSPPAWLTGAASTRRRASASSLLLSLFAGDMGVGKSCLLHQFTEKKCKCCLPTLARAWMLASKVARVNQSSPLAPEFSYGGGSRLWRIENSTARVSCSLPIPHSDGFLLNGTINKADSVCLIHPQPHHILHTHTQTHTPAVALEVGL